MNILVVDGEEGARIVFLNTLFRRGYQAAFAKSGEDALDHLGKGSFDLVITDSKLPAMDGLLLLDAIKKRSPEVDVIMVTDSGSIENYLKAVSLGVDEYICKPFRMKDLKWIINAFLARRKHNVLDQFGSEVASRTRKRLDDLLVFLKSEVETAGYRQPDFRQSASTVDDGFYEGERRDSM